VSKKLAQLAASGVMPLRVSASIQDGAPGGGGSGSGSNTAAWQLIRGAAVASPQVCPTLFII
jgi:hypothetical protein